MSRTTTLAALLFCLLTGCALPRLQTPGEAASEMSKSNQAQMEAQCGNTGQPAIDCKRRVRDEFAALRRRNAQDAR